MLIHATGSRHAGWNEEKFSWTNLAERVMSVLNLALQNVVTELDEMEPHFEEIVCRNNTLTKLRESAQGNVALKEGYTRVHKQHGFVFSRQD